MIGILHAKQISTLYTVKTNVYNILHIQKIGLIHHRLKITVFSLVDGSERFKFLGAQGPQSNTKHYWCKSAMYSPESQSSAAFFKASSAFCCQAHSSDSILQTKSYPQ